MFWTNIEELCKRHSFKLTLIIIKAAADNLMVPIPALIYVHFKPCSKANKN